METITREQIIDLINQYIYTNGTQSITAAQLREILIDIANAFAMKGGTVTGLDGVLEEGSSVTDGRVITNSFGGKVELAVAPLTTFGVLPDSETYKYLGISASDTSYVGQVYSSTRKTVIGNIRSRVAGKTFFDLQPPTKGEFYAGTIYNTDASSSDGTVGEGSSGSRDAGPAVPSVPGITNVTQSDKYTTIQMMLDGMIDTGVMSSTGEFSGYRIDLTGLEFNVQGPSQLARHRTGLDGINITLSSNDETSVSSRHQEISAITNTIVSGPQTSTHVQTPMSHRWSNENGDIAFIENSGLTLAQGKKIRAAAGGEAPTSGLATLTAGKVMILTSAVTASSVISLTVQETGDFKGNIRVSSKTPGTEFTISSSDTSDTCSVFWQIIDL